MELSISIHSYIHYKARALNIQPVSKGYRTVQLVACDFSASYFFERSGRFPTLTQYPLSFRSAIVTHVTRYQMFLCNVFYIANVLRRPLGEVSIPLKYLSRKGF